MILNNTKLNTFQNALIRDKISVQNSAKAKSVNSISMVFIYGN